MRKNVKNVTFCIKCRDAKQTLNVYFSHGSGNGLDRIQIEGNSEKVQTGRAKRGQDAILSLYVRLKFLRFQNIRTFGYFEIRVRFKFLQTSRIANYSRHFVSSLQTLFNQFETGISLNISINIQYSIVDNSFWPKLAYGCSQYSDFHFEII